MAHGSLIESQPEQAQKQARNRAAIWTLMVLAPVIAEVLSGSTRLSVLFVLLPEIMVWGVGALLARELVRRWRGGMPSLLMLGLALSIAEEFIVQQTSLAPLPFPGVNADYGRFAGVNWVYLLFMLGFESVWVVLVPVQVTELIFQDRRDRPWLRTRGIIACSLVFLVGCRMAWYGWTQQARPRMNMPPYNPPRLAMLLGLAAIGILIGLGYMFRGCGHAASNGSIRPASPWIGGIAAFLLGFVWWVPMMLIFNPKPFTRAPIAMASSLAGGLAAFLFFARLSRNSGWSDTHRWAVSFGATMACMAPSYISTAGWTRPDLVFKIIINLLAVVGLLLLARRVQMRREPRDHGER